MCTSQSDYQTPQVPVAEQEASYRRVIAAIRQQSKGKIVFISGASLNTELCRKNAENSRKHNGVGYLFGQPDKIEAFNAVLKKLSAELGIDYLDLYQPMQAHPDKAGLLRRSDGVHLAEPGHGFVALQVLKYLAAGGDHK